MCTTIGTMTIQHNGTKILHEATLCHETYFTLISGQRLQPHVMSVDADSAGITLKAKRKALYKMIRDSHGGNWIVAEEGKIRTLKTARNLHERYGHIVRGYVINGLADNCQYATHIGRQLVGQAIYLYYYLL